MSNLTNFPGDHDDMVLREALVRDIEAVSRMRGRVDHTDKLAHARQEGELNAFRMAIAIVRQDPEDPFLREIDRMMKQGQPPAGVVIPPRVIPFNPRPPKARPL